MNSKWIGRIYGLGMSGWFFLSYAALRQIIICGLSDLREYSVYLYIRNIIILHYCHNVVQSKVLLYKSIQYACFPPSDTDA